MGNPVEKQFKFCPRCSNTLERKTIDGRSRLHCCKCDFIFWNNPKPCVSIILEKNGKVFLLERLKEPLKDFWVLPGGYVEYDEKPEQSIVREAKEETTMDIKVDKLVGVYLIDNDPRGNSLDTIYSGTIINGSPQLKEHSQYQFFSIDNLPEQIAYKHRRAISDWAKIK